MDRNIVSTPVIIKSAKSKTAYENKGGYTLGSQFFYGTINGKGRANPSRVSFMALRNLSLANNLVRNCINRIKHSIGRIDWFVKLKDDKADPAKYQEQIDYVTNLILHPNKQEGMRSLLSKIAEDMLTIDNGVIEKVRNSRGTIVELYTVDGATIRPNIDEFGLLADPAYYQYLELNAQGVKPDAEFTEDDLIVFQVNPQSQNGRIGYGLSPVEGIVQTVVTTLQAAIYNETFFNSKKLPPFVGSLPNVPIEDLRNFKMAFEKSVENDDWTTAWVNSENFDIKPLRPTNQDMQFEQLNEWLAKIIFSAFELSPQDFGMTGDINKATSQTQERMEQGVHNITNVIEEKINECIIADLAEEDPAYNDIQFEFDTVNKVDELQQAQINDIYVKDHVLLPNDVRSDLGLDPVEGGDSFAGLQPTTDKMSSGDFSGVSPVAGFSKSSKWLGWY